jgi:proteasome lid subunit RPN8/RPN11
LPKQLELGEHVAQQMDTLWQKSVQDIDKGVVREHAATLVEGRESKLKLVNPVEGDEYRVRPDREVAEGEKLVGTFHTHPYREGYTAVAFSGQDIANVINSHDDITVVQSGEGMFALRPTDKTPDAIDPAMLRREFHQRLGMHADEGMTFPEAMYAANLDMCEKYGIAMYRGRHGILREVYRP